MNSWKKTLFLCGILVALFGGIYFWRADPESALLSSDIAPDIDIALPEVEEAVIETNPLADRVTESGTLEGNSKSPTSIETAVPKPWEGVFFTSQAPTGEWTKSEFQNGCEEASALMVHAWRSGEVYTKDEVREELLAMARYQEKQIGQAIDTDAADTAETLLNSYFYISDYRLAYDFTLEELKQALIEGVVIVPTNGQALKNPNFTRPGPIQHMLVVTGYDAEKKEFITNDPGTSKGEGYRYAEAVLYGAIREYPTGKHLPIVGERKAMIVIPSASVPLSITP